MWPGPGGPVPGPVARSRWPGPRCPVPVARCRAVPRPFFLPWPGGPVPVPVCRLTCPGLVLVARWWPGAVPRGPGLPSVLPRSGFGGPVARSRSRLRSALMAVARARSRSRSRWPGPGGPVPVARSRWPGPGGPVPVARVPVPIKRITYAVWPASMLPGMDAQSLPGIWLFYAVLQTTGERQTILRSRNHYRTKTGAKRLPKPTA